MAHKLVAESFALRNHDAVARNQLEKTSSFLGAVAAARKAREAVDALGRGQ